jgi:YggT family protein
MTTILIPILQVLDVALQLYMWVVIAAVILSWLVAFNVINTHSQAVRAIGNFLHQLTEPLLRRIRRVVPNFGGLDLSPIILLLGILLIRLILGRLIVDLAT